jgi:hypothetical protein
MDLLWTTPFKTVVQAAVARESRSGSSGGELWEMWLQPENRLQDSPNLCDKAAQVSQEQSEGWGLRFGAGAGDFWGLAWGCVWELFPGAKRSLVGCCGSADASVRDWHPAGCI